MATAMKWAVIVLAALDAGYMAFDGGLALTTGDYLTPSSGEYAGQLGPWTHLSMAFGIEPRSTLMKSIFLGYGLAWLAIIALFAAGARRGSTAMLAAAAGSTWNLFVGTAFGLLLVALLLFERRCRRTCARR